MVEAASLADLTYTSNTGEEVALADFVGRPVLIVNTARHCGFAPQFHGLQKLHEEYGPRGLVVLGFPCDQFAHQEPGEDAVIAEECKVNFGVTFPLSTKIDVNGAHTHPVFRFLKRQSSGRFGPRIKWNFTKFLVEPDGVTVTRFPPHKTPRSLISRIERLLEAGQAPAASEGAAAGTR